MPGAQVPLGHDWFFVMWATFGTFVSILLLTGVASRAVLSAFKRVSYSSNSSDLEGGYRVLMALTAGAYELACRYILVLLNSMAALAAMLFSASSSPLVQPRNVFFGHLIAAVVAICISYLSGNGSGRAYMPQLCQSKLLLRDCNVHAGWGGPLISRGGVTWGVLLDG
eukprot:760860-Hanusia_phi.AAC.2